MTQFQTVITIRKNHMQNTVCRMAIAGPHKFLFEINDFLFVKTFIQMADIIDHLIAHARINAYPEGILHDAVGVG